MTPLTGPPGEDDLTIGPGTTTRKASFDSPAGTGSLRAGPRAVVAAASSRFAPGAIVAGRYRLVALLGRGGMGEVYRADDLTLDQPVALKFLPEGVAVDAERLAQFHNELRVARQVSHKNVCRLYDLGEADGRRFLTMEYVDGEDLGSLLRRIGRFPEDRALAVARQLCAGVAAAHERGVIHRDLKPANVMIDGDGNVRITDFGIATAGADGGGGIVGTPQYMAPEVLSGQRASVRSDIYALGLILFEVFTGKRVHDAKTLHELKALHDTGTVTTPSSLVRDIDSAVERIILRCLERDPERRPASALGVAAGLPGADPLAAALAAGETPSPEMLAAAAETEALGVGPAVAMVAFVAFCIAVIVVLSPRASVSGLVPLDRPPAVLLDRAQQIRASLGYTEAVVDSADGFQIAPDYLQWIADNDQRPQRWEALRSGSPPALIFWTRTSPRLLVPQRAQPEVTTVDPPHTISGMTFLLLDTRGRMVEFHAIPPQFDPDRPAAPEPPRWDAMFEAAGLDLRTFTPVQPAWSPRDFADTRAAWEGALPEHADARVRIEAASYRGRLTSMLMVGPWSRPTRMTAAPLSTARRAWIVAVTLVLIALSVAAILLARFNITTKRANVRAATRLALFVMIGYAISWLFAAHHVPDVNAEFNLFIRYFSDVLFSAGLLWVVYVALEPYVRRFWPDGILGWTRLLSGYVRDPRVGRDVLLGCTFGTGLLVLQIGYFLAPTLIGRPGPVPSMLQSDVNALLGLGAAVSTTFDELAGGLFSGTFVILGFVLLKLIFRRMPIVIAAGALLMALVQAGQVINTATPLWISVTFQLLLIATVTTLVIRYGLLVAIVASGIGNVLGGIPLTPALAHWTATTSNVAVAVVLGITLFGYYASRAGQPLFGKLEV